MSKKIGAGHVAAMARLGLKELRNAVNPSKESIADSEIGVFGTQTQGEIAEAREGPGAGPEEEARPEKKMTLDELRQSAKQQTQQAEKGIEKDAPKQQQERGEIEL